MAKRILAIILAAVMVFAFAACANTDAPTDAEGGETTGMAPIAKEDLKVGFVYIGDIHDGGYTQAHDKGRLALEAEGIEIPFNQLDVHVKNN